MRVQAQSLAAAAVLLLAASVAPVQARPHQMTIRGRVIGVDWPHSSFMLQTARYGNVAVRTAPRTRFNHFSAGLNLATQLAGAGVTAKGWRVGANLLNATSVTRAVPHLRRVRRLVY